MTTKSLNIISKLLKSKNINYSFSDWIDDKIPKTYWTGDYSEVSGTDDESQETTFILIGTSTSRLELEKQKEIIVNLFKNYLVNTNDLAFCVGNIRAVPIPSVDKLINRMQINIQIKEWGV